MDGKASSNTLAVAGTKVGARRWPYEACDPCCWLPPLVGTVLTIDDVRAWSDTLAFCGVPTLAQTRAHVQDLLARGLLQNKVPVEWETDRGPRILWATNDDLVTPEQDLAAWRNARNLAFARGRRVALRLAA